MVRVLGVVLAGGRALRFGSDKAAAILGGRTLLDHALESLRPVVAAVAVSGRANPVEIAIADWPAADLGPLGGLCGALYYAAANGFDGVLTTACDTPSLPRALLDALLLQGAPAYCADTPVIGYWPTALAGALSDYLTGDHDRSVRAWAASAGAVPIASPSIPNVNRPEDLERLKAAIAP